MRCTNSANKNINEGKILYRETQRKKDDRVLLKTKRADFCQCVIPSAVVFFSAILVTAWDFIYSQNRIYDLNIVGVIGVTLFLMGVAIRRVGKNTLGEYYSYGLRTSQNHKLIKRGIYRYVRHPISLAAMMYSMGIPLIFSSLYGTLLMLVMIPLILNRIRIEEKMLLKRFGEEYREYMKETKKLVPLVY